MSVFAKTLLGFMIVINIAFFAWQYDRQITGDATLQATGSPGKNVTKLILLSEYREQVALESSVSAPQESAAHKNAREPAPEVPETADARDTHKAAMDTSRTETEPATAAQQAASGACATIGPTSDQSLANTWLQRLNESGFTATLRQERKTTKRVYWVYLPPFLSRSSAVKVIRKLNDEGVLDYAIVSGGEMNNAISLGVFTSETAAQRRLAALESKGYHPLLQKRTGTRIRYWVDVTSRATVGPSGSREIKLSGLFPGVAIQGRDCR